MKKDIIIIICKSDSDFDIAKTVTRDYEKWLDMDLCFQNIESEYKTFKTMYSQPEGCFIYALNEGKVAGAVGFRKLEDTICEMKRLFVYDSFQGKGIGRILSKTLLSISKTLGYTKMRLDTISKLKAAIQLYESLGFYDIQKYRENPDTSVRYMEIDLIEYNSMTLNK